MLGKGWICTLKQNKTIMERRNMASAESAAIKYHILLLHNLKRERKINFKKEEREKVHINHIKEKDRRST
jgi:hypothetical protein